MERRLCCLLAYQRARYKFAISLPCAYVREWVRERTCIVSLGVYAARRKAAARDAHCSPDCSCGSRSYYGPQAHGRNVSSRCIRDLAQTPEAASWLFLVYVCPLLLVPNLLLRLCGRWWVGMAAQRVSVLSLIAWFGDSRARARGSFAVHRYSKFDPSLPRAIYPARDICMILESASFLIGISACRARWVLGLYNRYGRIISLWWVLETNRADWFRLIIIVREGSDR